MSSRGLARCLSLLLLLFTACGSGRVGGGGGGGPDADSSGGACTTSAQCGGATPICSAGGTCVQCVTSADCPADLPLCSASACVAGCTGTAVTADFVKLPSDIIWVVDQSGSMNQETAYVQQKINDFASLIDASGVDYHVVMIADPNASNSICVPPPLGGPSCGNNTRFRLVPVKVHSHDGPQLAVTDYSMYSDFLRPDATKHFVFVTDDNSAMSAAAFTQAVLALPPAGMFDGFKVHAIYAYGTPGGQGCTGPFGTGAAEGTVYTELVAQTGGARGIICTGDWTQVFHDITQAVVAGAQVSCDLTIPPPPAGQTLDPTKVNVRYLPGGTPPGQTIPNVPDAASCGAGGGWYYDNNASPTTITLCPSSCTAVQNDATASLQVEFGCGTVVN